MSTPKDIAAPYMQHLETIRTALESVQATLKNRGEEWSRDGVDYIAEALEALSKIPPALSVVEAATELLKLHDIKQHVEACNATDCAPYNDKVLYYMENKAWENLRAALSQGEAVQKDGGLVVTKEMFEHGEGDRLKTGAGPSAAISPKTERISATVPVAPARRPCPDCGSVGAFCCFDTCPMTRPYPPTAQP